MLQHPHNLDHTLRALLHRLGWGFVVFCLLLMTNAFAQPHAPDTLWTRDYVDSNTALYPASIMSTPDGGFAVAGTWGYFDYLNYDAGLMKMGSDGTVQWSHRFGVPEVLEYVTCAAHTTDGGFFLAGFTQGQDTSESHLLAVKYDWAGDSLWSLPIRIDGGARASKPPLNYQMAIWLWVIRWVVSLPFCGSARPAASFVTGPSLHFPAI